MTEPHHKWFQGVLLKSYVQLITMPDTGSAVNTLLLGLFHRQVEDNMVASVFSAIASLFPHSFTQHDWGSFPFIVDMYNHYPGVSQAVTSMLQRNLPISARRLLVSNDWLSRTCCLFQPPNVLLHVMNQILKAKEGCPPGALVSVLRACRGATLYHVQLHTKLTPYLLSFPGFGEVKQECLLQTLSQAVLLRHEDMLRRTLDMCLSFPTTLLGSESVMPTFLAALTSTTKKWEYVAKFMGKHTVIGSVWTPWLAAEVIGVVGAGEICSPGIIHCLAKFAEAGNPEAAQRLLSDIVHINHCTASSVAYLFAVARAVHAVRHVEPLWTGTVIRSLCADGAHLVRLQTTLCMFPRLPRRFIRAHLDNLTKLGELWSEHGRDQHCKLTEILWRCYRAPHRYWEACALMCDGRDAPLWTQWVRRHIRTFTDFTVSMYTFVIGPMISACHRHVATNSGVSVFLQTLAGDTAFESPMKTWVLERVISVPNMPRTTFRRILLHVLRFLQQRQVSVSTSLLLHATDASLRALNFNVHPSSYKPELTMLAVDMLQTDNELHGAGLISLLTHLRMPVGAASRINATLRKPWCHGRTKVLALTLLARCKWEEGVHGPILSRAVEYLTASEDCESGDDTKNYRAVCVMLLSFCANVPGMYPVNDLLRAEIEKHLTWNASESLTSEKNFAKCACTAVTSIANMEYGWVHEEAYKHYFTKHAILMILERDTAGIKMLVSLPAHNESLASLSDIAGFWRSADASLDDLPAGDEAVLRVGLAIRALLGPSLPTDTAFTAIQFLSSVFPYSPSDFRAILHHVEQGNPDICVFTKRFWGLAEGTLETLSPCVCDSNRATCHHSVFAFPSVSASASQVERIDCSVCYEPITLYNAAQMSCGHVFHDQCIEAWIARSQAREETTCPLCRTRVEVRYEGGIYRPFPARPLTPLP